MTKLEKNGSFLGKKLNSGEKKDDNLREKMQEKNGDYKPKKSL